MRLLGAKNGKPVVVYDVVPEDASPKSEIIIPEADTQGIIARAHTRVYKKQKGANKKKDSCMA